MRHEHHFTTSSMHNHLLTVTSEMMHPVVRGRSNLNGLLLAELLLLRLQVPAQAAAAAALAEAGASGYLSPGGAGALREALASEKVLQNKICQTGSCHSQLNQLSVNLTERKERGSDFKEHEHSPMLCLSAANI
jgi:hypothetical protein